MILALRDTFKGTCQRFLLFGNEPTPELLAILTVYFIQGVLGLAQLAVKFFLKDDLGLSPTRMAALSGIIALPWVIKPLFGFLSDGVPIAGYRRRPYLILAGILGSLAWIALATIARDDWTATLFLILTSVSVATSDVIIDSIVVERARRESVAQSGSMQSLMWTVWAIGGLLTAYLSGWLLARFGSQTVFAITAVFPLVVTAIAGLIAEKPITNPENKQDNQQKFLRIRQTATLISRTVRQKYILLPTLFICLWQVTPTADTAFFYFQTNELKLGPEFLGLVQAGGNLAILSGTFLYQVFFKTTPFRKILGWSIVLSSVLGMTTLLLVTHANRVMGIPDRWFCLGDSFILRLTAHLSFLPVFVLSARLCPVGIEATIFAFLVSLFGLSAMMATESGALLTHWLGISPFNFENLWILVMIANLLTLLPLPLLRWIPNDDPRQVMAEEERKQSVILPSVELSAHSLPVDLTLTSLVPELMPTFVTTINPSESETKFDDNSSKITTN
jgi:folate/biopterin transporter